MSAESEALQAAADQVYAFLQETKKSNIYVIHGADAGAVNNITLTPTPAVHAWTDDLIIVALVANETTAAVPTLKVSELPAIPITLWDGSPLIAGDVSGLALFKIQGTGTVQGPKARLLFLGPEAYARRFPATIPDARAPLFFDALANEYAATLSTADQVRAGATAAALVTPAALAGSMARVPLAFAATVNWDMAAGYNRELSLSGNCTIAAPTNVQPGASGSLTIIPTGNFAVAWNSAWDWGAAGPPVIPGGAGKIHLVTFQHVSSNPLKLRPSFSAG